MHKSCPRMHECKLHTQAQVRIRMNTDNGSFFDIFEYPSIKNHPKHVPTQPKVLGFHLNPSHSKTQEFTCLNMD